MTKIELKSNGQPGLFIKMTIFKKPKDLSACESEERGCGEGGGVYAVLVESDDVETKALNCLL
jgi:hypothetical protein